MRGIGRLLREQVCFAFAIAVLSVSGCSVQPVEPEPVDATPEIVIEPPQPTVADKPPRKIPEPPRLPPVAIVLTSNQPAYAEVAKELANRFDDFDVYDLSDRSQPPVSVLRTINDSGSRAVVAIGLRAAQSSVAMAETPVVFSQVFNYQDNDLLSETSRGVASLAPLDAQLAAWTKIDPTIKRIGVIIGQGHDDIIAEAELAAERNNVKLVIRVADSDQETLYFFRRMIRDIDGFWLFPDNRILSARVMQQMLDDANRLQVPVAVPNESMLAMGATISLATVAADIADTIVKVLRRIQAGDLERVPPISRLSEIRVTTNGAVRVADR